MNISERVRDVTDFIDGKEYVDSLMEKVKAAFKRENLEYFFLFMLLGIIYVYLPLTWFQRFIEVVIVGK